MTIREATLKDIETLRAFEQGVINYERPFALNLKETPIQYYNLEDFIQRKDAQVVVATIEEEIVGSGYALIKNAKPHKTPEQYAYLGFMYVLPNFRGKGINQKIIEELIRWSKNQGLTEVYLDVYAENDSALKAYNKIGFQPYLLNMRLDIKE